MFFEELGPLPEILPSLKETGFNMRESHWMTDGVIMPLTWIWLKLRSNALCPIGKFLWWGMGTFHKPPYRVELQVQATGFKGGQPARVNASPLALAGSLLLLWAALRARSHRAFIGGGLAIAIGLLAGAQVLAEVTGLASGRIEPSGIWFFLALSGLFGYTLMLVAITLGGLLLLRDLNRTTPAARV
jgi:hypothetical protein